MARFFLPSDQWGEAACLSGDEAKHLSQVLRIRVGEEVVVFDGKGQQSTAKAAAKAIIAFVERSSAQNELADGSLAPVDQVA
jgi:16S rRNA U1498 N3-methylase RsmE